MRFLPYVLIVLLGLTTATAVVTRREQQNPSLPERIQESCKPWLVNDWWIMDETPNLVRVSCFDPKTGTLRYTVVGR